MKMRVCMLCIFNIVLNVAVIAEKTPITTIKDCSGAGRVFNGQPHIEVAIEELAILHFPADVELGCKIWLHNYWVASFKLTLTDEIPCHWIFVRILEGKGEEGDMCKPMLTVYKNVILHIEPFEHQRAGSPEVNLVITPTWQCGMSDTNVSCCYDRYIKDYAMLCDEQLCIREKYICDGVRSCVDGKDEGKICDTTTPPSNVNSFRSVTQWVLVAAATLVVIG